MACSIRETIFKELRKNNFIDEHNNIIGETADVFPYIIELNNLAVTRYGAKKDLLETFNVKNNAGTFTKVRLNDNLVEEIDKKRQIEEEKNISPSGTLGLESRKNTIKPSKDLTDRLISFNNKLGFTVNSVESVRELTGFNAESATDLLYKNILINNNPEQATDSLVIETAYVAYAMLGTKNKIRTDLFHSLENLSNFKEIFAEYTKMMPNMNDYKKKEIMLVDFIADAIHNEYNTPRDSYVHRKAEYWQIKSNSKLEKKLKILWIEIKKLVEAILGKSKGVSELEFNEIIASVANDVVHGYMDKYSNNLTEDQQLVNYEDTIAKDPQAGVIIQDFADMGLVLTGSLALRTQGTLYRTEAENLHDLDFSATTEHIDDFVGDALDEENLDIDIPHHFWRLPELHQEILLAELTYAAKKKKLNQLTKKIMSSKLMMDIKAKYPQYKFKTAFPGLKSKEISVLGSIKIGESVYDIDVFFTVDEALDTNRKNFQDWEHIFKAKIKMGRAKDMSDFVHYKPFNIENIKPAQVTGLRHFNFKRIAPPSVNMHKVGIVHNNRLYAKPGYTLPNSPSQQQGLGSRKNNFEGKKYSKPISENYLEIARWKLSEYDKVTREVNKVKISLRTQDTSKNRAYLKYLEEEQRKLKQQVDMLSEKKIEYMFNTIFEDLEDIQQALEAKELHDSLNIKARLSFYEDFKDSLDHEDTREEYDAIAGQVSSLLRSYDALRVEKVKNNLEESEVIQNTLRNLNKDKSLKERFGKKVDENTGELEDFEVNDLLAVVSDINAVDKNFLGLISANTGDTVLPQFLMQEFRTTLFRNQQAVGKLIDELNAFVTRTGIKDRDFLMSRDEKGNLDGFLVDIYSKKWFSQYKDLSERIGVFYKSDSKNKRKSFIQVKNWFSKNTELIDFTKLPAIHAIYAHSSEYSKYFKTSEKDMEAYEKSLRDKLGPRYDSIEETILNKLAKFEEFKNDTDIQKKSKTFERDVAQRDLWQLLDNWKKNSIEPTSFKYTHKGETKKGNVYFDQFKDIPIIPRETVVDPFLDEEVSSGFYNENFNKIKENKDYSELWGIYKRMSEYIDSRYELEEEHGGRISYPKLEATYAERLNESWTKVKSNPKSFGKVLGETFVELAHEYKGFFYEKGRLDPTKDNTGVVSNYSDTSKREIAARAKMYQLKGMTPKEAKERATAEILPSYSTDIDMSFKAVLLEAALHDTRKTLESSARDILETHKKQKDANGEDRKNSIARLEHYINKIILNRHHKERGTMSIVGKNISEESTLAKIFNYLQELPLIKKWLANKSLRLLSDKEKELVNGYKALKGKPLSIDNWRVEEGPFLLQKSTVEIQDDEATDLSTKFHTDYVVNGKLVSAQEFDEAYQQYIDYKIRETGLDLNLAGIIDGILKTLILRGLALSPVSGIFNRIEGMHTTMIMDVTGQYWTPGNSDIAKKFMAFANTMNMSDRFVRGKDKERKKQLEIFEQILQKLDILQNRKNELQKNTEDDKDIAGWIYKWAVDAPEFKNQGTVILSVLMDQTILDNAGNEHKLFDGEKFAAFDLVDGVLTIKPEFSDFNFNSNQMANLVVKLESTVAHSQGNYNAYDIMMAKKDIWGRALMLFRTWMPEHINQRFGITGHDNELNIDLSHEKLRRGGRFTQAFKSSKTSFVTYTAATLGISYAGLGFMGMFGVGLIGAYVYQKFISKISNKQTIKRDANIALEFTQFLQSTLMESLNYPSRLMSSVPGVNKLQFNTTGDSWANAYRKSNMTEQDIASIRAMSRELAIMLVLLSGKLLAGALMYDDDDDKESPERKRYNFVQNQLSRSISTLATWSDPTSLVSDNQRIGAWSYLKEIVGLLHSIALDPDREKAGKHFWKLAPLPNMISKMTTGNLPWEDNMNYDDLQSQDKLPVLKWTSDTIKDWDTNGEKSAKKKYSEIRADRREELKEEYMDEADNKQELKAIVDSKMAEEIGAKEEGESYVNTLQSLRDNGMLNTKDGRETLKNSFKNMGLSDEEIGRRMHKIYSEK